MWGEKTDFFENRKGRFWGSGEYTRWGDAAFEAVEEAIDVVLEIVAHHRPLLDWGFHLAALVVMRSLSRVRSILREV